MTLEKIAAKGFGVDSLTYLLDKKLVPEDDIEAVNVMLEGMKHGLLQRAREHYDSGNSRRQAITEQKARHG